MPPALQAKTLGLPRWAWVLVIAGGLTIGIILRQRQKQAQSLTNDPSQDCDPTDPNGDCYDPSLDPGNAGYIDPTASDLGVPYGTGSLPNGSGGATVTVNFPPDSGTPIPPTDGGDCGRKPDYKAPKGMKWECKNGRWALSGTPAGGGGGGGGQGHDCPKGQHWDHQLKRCVTSAHTGGGDDRKCPKGQHQNQDGKCVDDHPGNHHGPGPKEPVVVTGGGPPKRHDIHSVAPSRTRRR